MLHSPSPVRPRRPTTRFASVNKHIQPTHPHLRAYELPQTHTPLNSVIHDGNPIRPGILAPGRRELGRCAAGICPEDQRVTGEALLIALMSSPALGDSRPRTRPLCAPHLRTRNPPFGPYNSARYKYHAPTHNRLRGACVPPAKRPLESTRRARSRASLVVCT